MAVPNLVLVYGISGIWQQETGSATLSGGRPWSDRGGSVCEEGHDTSAVQEACVCGLL